MALKPADAGRAHPIDRARRAARNQPEPSDQMTDAHRPKTPSTASAPPRARPSCASPTCGSPRSPARRSRSALLKIYTNQGIVGFGEVRDGASATYALMLKSRLLGENPCDIDRLFRRIKQFGGHGRQGGGVSAVEIALWDLAGKAYGVPVWQMLGGKFRDKVRIYCDTDADRPSGTEMGKRLKERMDARLHLPEDGPRPDADRRRSRRRGQPGRRAGRLPQPRRPHAGPRRWTSAAHRNAVYDAQNVMHPFTGLHFSDKGLDLLEQYIAEVRDVIGPEIPLAIDHVGHISLQDGIRLARRIEKYTPAWLEDVIPWQYAEQYRQLQEATSVPICTGEDIYLKEGFEPLLEGRHLGHPPRPADHRRHPRDQEDRRHGAGPRRRDGDPHGRKPDRRDGRGACRGRHRELHGAGISLGRRAVVGRHRRSACRSRIVKDGFITVTDSRASASTISTTSC